MQRYPLTHADTVQLSFWKRFSASMFESEFRYVRALLPQLFLVSGDDGECTQDVVRERDAKHFQFARDR